MGRVRWLVETGRLGAVPTTEWYSNSCSSRRVRWLDDGTIEIEGLGAVVNTMPSAVGQWAPIVWSAATRYGVPPQLVGGTMSVESGGNPNAYNDENGGKNKGIGLM